jgi:hypothetical protein
MLRGNIFHCFGHQFTANFFVISFILWLTKPHSIPTIIYHKLKISKTNAGMTWVGLVILLILRKQGSTECSLHEPYKCCRIRHPFPPVLLCVLVGLQTKVCSKPVLDTTPHQLHHPCGQNECCCKHMYCPGQSF